jgi:hypothetical protein
MHHTVWLATDSAVSAAELQCSSQLGSHIGLPVPFSAHALKWSRWKKSNQLYKVEALEARAASPCSADHASAVVDPSGNVNPLRPPSIPLHHKVQQQRVELLGLL